MKNVISYSLWGDSDVYWNGAFRNIELSKVLFPDFVCRFYIDSECDPDRIEQISNKVNVEVIIINSSDIENKNKIENRFKFEGMFWRFYAIDDMDVDIFLSRDCDSRLSERESAAVNEWIKSNRNFHIMRDHPYHQTPILGGMWGCKSKFFRNLDFNFRNESNKYLSSNFPVISGKDQDFLSREVYPIIRNESLIHSEFGINFGENINRFPTKREDYEFVGDAFDHNNNRHPDYWKIIKNVIG
jgi:hypothetical protein